MIESGKLIYKIPTIEETRQNVKNNLALLWDEALRLSYPHTYIINLSPKLARLKSDLLNKYSN